MKTITLIGGAGYVGSVLTQHFLKLGFNVTVLDNFIYDNQFASAAFFGSPQYNFVFGDLDDHTALENACSEADFVVLLGGLVGDPITKKYPNHSDRINDLGVKKCIDFFDDKAIRQLIFVSTCSNYGLIKEDELADENFELNPLSLYAKAKVSAELHLLAKKGNVSYDGVVLRFATAFGLSPRMRFDLSISEFVRDLYFGKELLVFDEHTWRPYCHVRDFARLIELVVTAPAEKVSFEVFNAGGEENNFTKKMIVDQIIGRLSGAKVKYTSNGSDPRNYKVSFKKVNDALAFRPEYSVGAGIDELVNALELGFFADSLSDKNRYGNYQIREN